MDSVQRGKQIVKTAARIGDQENALGFELPPGGKLPGQEKQSQGRGDRPPLAEGSRSTLAELPDRNLNRNAAGEKRQRVNPDDARQDKRNPVAAQPLAYQKRAGERHEEHDDAG